MRRAVQLVVGSEHVGLRIGGGKKRNVDARGNAAGARVAVRWFSGEFVWIQRVHEAGSFIPDRGLHLIARGDELGARFGDELGPGDSLGASVETVLLSAVHFAHPPLRTAALSKPKARSIHHRRDAHMLSWRSYTTTAVPSPTPSLDMAATAELASRVSFPLLTSAFRPGRGRRPPRSFAPPLARPRPGTSPDRRE